MPKRADHSLTWRDDTQAYELCGVGSGCARLAPTGATAPGRAGSLGGVASLASFAFTSRAGHVCTVRQEAAARGGTYWYAYRRAGPRMLKRYLGRTDVLTVARLEATAATLDAAARTEANAPARDAASHRGHSQASARQHASASASTSTSTASRATSPRSPDLASSALLATKLHVPRTASSLVERPLVMARLADGLERALTLVSAPAGFGKTTALAQWARNVGASGGRPVPVAWVALDASDDDPVQFWLYVLAALERAMPGIAATALSMLRGPRPGPAPIEAVLRALLNDIAALPAERHLALVLDDYHRITAPAIHEAVALLLEHPPAQLHLYLAGRSEPPLPLARLRVRDQTVELRAPDLRFAPTEVAEFAATLGLALAPEDVAALAERSGGWPAALRLAAVSLRGHPDPARFIAAFDGSHRDVLAYLGDEVLAAQPAEVQAFLLETALLDRFCAPLCDAVTSRADAQATIERLERASLFVIPLDDERRWYRYDALFAELLRHRLRAEMPDRAPALHHRTADWLAENGWIAEAAEHLLAAGDVEAAALLLERSARGMIQRGEHPALLRLLERLPRDVMFARPALVVYRAEALLYRGELEATERSLEEAERLIAAHAADGGHERRGEPAVDWEALAIMVRGGRAALAAMRGDGAATLAYARATLALPGADDDPYRRGGALLTLAHAYRINGQMRAAETAYDQAAVALEAAGELPLVAVALGLRALVLVQMGRLRAAAEVCRRMIVRAEERSAGEGAAFGSGHVGLGQVLYEWNDLDAAQAALESGVTLGERSTSLYDQTAGLVALAAVWQARGEPETALDMLRRAERLMHSGAQFPWLVPLLGALRALLALRQGHITVAERWAAERGLLDGTFEPRGPIQVQECEHLTFARLLLRKGDGQAAAEIVERLLPQAIREERAGSEIELRIVAALAYEAAGCHDDALDALATALELAAPEGYVRLFVDEGAPLHVLLLRLREWYAGGEGARHAPLRAYIEKLLAAFEGEAVPQAEGTAPAPVEPLSAREREVLALLAEGRSSQEIADQLVVAVSTIKTHIHHIYTKLQAGGRVRAITCARELGLLD
ncbi:MAG TPA: LuxR C-terminal-related transcriptional regulator [Ktedonobacterales bacterium]